MKLYPLILSAALLLSASAVRADGVPTPPTPLHAPPAPEPMMPPPALLSPWETLVQPRTPDPTRPPRLPVDTPEPGTALLLGAGLVALGTYKRRAKL